MQKGMPDSSQKAATLCSQPSPGQYADVGYGSMPGQTVRVTRRFWEFPSGPT